MIWSPVLGSSPSKTRTPATHRARARLLNRVVHQSENGSTKDGVTPSADGDSDGDTDGVGSVGLPEGVTILEIAALCSTQAVQLLPALLHHWEHYGSELGRLVYRVRPAEQQQWDPTVGLQTDPSDPLKYYMPEPATLPTADEDTHHVMQAIIITAEPEQDPAIHKTIRDFRVRTVYGDLSPTTETLADMATTHGLTVPETEDEDLLAADSLAEPASLTYRVRRGNDIDDTICNWAEPVPTDLLVEKSIVARLDGTDPRSHRELVDYYGPISTTEVAAVHEEPLEDARATLEAAADVTRVPFEEGEWWQ